MRRALVASRWLVIAALLGVAAWCIVQVPPLAPRLTEREARAMVLEGGPPHQVAKVVTDSTARSFGVDYMGAGDDDGLMWVIVGTGSFAHSCPQGEPAACADFVWAAEWIPDGVPPGTRVEQAMSASQHLDSQYRRLNALPDRRNPQLSFLVVGVAALGVASLCIVAVSRRRT